MRLATTEIIQLLAAGAGPRLGPWLLAWGGDYQDPMTTPAVYTCQHGLRVVAAGAAAGVIQWRKTHLGLCGPDR